MDVISHALIGAAIGEAAKPRKVALCAALAAAPDFPQALFLYPYVAWTRGHFPVPEHADWDGFRDAHPYASAVWELPHSAFFLLLVVVPLVRRFKLPWTCAAAYASHILLDVFTHTGEWATAPLWPLPPKLEGFSDPWRWTPAQWAVSIGLCSALWLAVRRFARRA